MSQGFPEWLRLAFRSGVLDEGCAAEVQRRARDGSLTASDLRTLLLVPIDGPGVHTAQRAALEYVVCRPHLAATVLAIHTDSARIPAPTIRVRSTPSSGGLAFEAQASLVADSRTVASGWHEGQTKKAARQRAQVDLLARLAGVAEDAVEREGSRCEGGTPELLVSGAFVTTTSGRQFSVDATSNPMIGAAAPLTTVHLREAPATAPLATVTQALSRGADLVFETGTAVGQATFLCLASGLGRREREQPGFVSRTLLMPGGELTHVDCLRADVLELLHVLLSADGDAWSEATHLWARVARLAVQTIREGRCRPGITEADHQRGRQPTWRIGPITPVMREHIEALADELAVQPQSVRRSDKGRSQPDDWVDPAGAVCACLDAIADRFVPAPGFRYLLGTIPFAARVDYKDPIVPLQDWADSVEDILDTEPTVQVVLRIPAPRDDRATTLRATLRLAVVPDSLDTAVDAAMVWSRQEYFPGFSFDLRRRVARALRRAGIAFPPLRALGMQPFPEAFILSLGEAAALRGQVGHELLRAGITVEWHKDWAADLSAHVVVGTGSPAPVGQGGLGLGEVLDRRWRITLDGVALTEDEMDALAVQALPCVRLHNRWVLLDEDIRDRLRDRRLPPVTCQQGVLEVLSGHVTIGGTTYACTAEGGIAALIEELRASDEQSAANTACVGLFNTTLYAYQHSAVNWLNRVTALGFGALLADDMGTGKTITAERVPSAAASLEFGADSRALSERTDPQLGSADHPPCPTAQGDLIPRPQTQSRRSEPKYHRAYEL